MEQILTCKIEDDSKQSTTTNKCTKIWSENTNKRRYIPKDPEYFKNKYYEYVGPKTCTACGAVVNTQMCRHTRSKRCLLVQAGIARALDITNNP